MLGVFASPIVLGIFALIPELLLSLLELSLSILEPFLDFLNLIIIFEFQYPSFGIFLRVIHVLFLLCSLHRVLFVLGVCSGSGLEFFLSFGEFLLG